MTDPNPEAAKAAHEAFWDSYQMAPSDYQINIALDAALEDYHRVAFAALPCQPDAARERVIELERELELMRRDYLAAAAHAESLGSVEERLPDGDDDTKPLWHAHARFGTPSSQPLNASQEGGEANSAVRSDERTGLHTKTAPDPAGEHVNVRSVDLAQRVRNFSYKGLAEIIDRETGVVDLLAALRLIAHQRDYMSEHARYDSAFSAPAGDWEFDDWAADLASTTIA